MEQKSTKNKGLACFITGAVLFSILFLLVSSGLWVGGKWLLYVCLTAGSLAIVVLLKILWQRERKDARAAALLLFVFMVDYWMWTLFAHYPRPGSYAFLAVAEGVRLTCIVLLLCFAWGYGKVRLTFNIWMWSVFILELPSFFLSRTPLGVEKNILYASGIFHPLLFVPYLVILVFHLNMIGVYTIKFREVKDEYLAERKDDQ